MSVINALIAIAIPPIPPILDLVGGNIVGAFDDSVFVSLIGFTVGVLAGVVIAGGVCGFFLAVPIDIRNSVGQQPEPDTRSGTMKTLNYVVLVLVAFVLSGAQVTAQDADTGMEKYLLLATNRTGTMQQELNEAGARGYRFAGAQGGETAFGGREAVVLMQLDPDGKKYRYILLATSRTSTMHREMNEAPSNYRFAGMTVFTSTFGGKEAAVILEADLVD